MDHAQLGQLYERYSYLVHRRCLRILRSPSEADDALQEVYVKAQRQDEAIAGPPLFWLYAIATNVSFDLLRRRRRQASAEGETGSRVAGSSGDGDLRAWLGALLRRLDPRTRQVGVLHFLAAWPRQEVAFKGQRLTVIARRTGSAPHALRRGEPVRAGDALRFAYSGERPGYLAILDVDGTGRVASFYPYGGAAFARFDPASGPVLPGSVVLDGAPGPERLVAVFSPAPRSLESLSRQLAPVHGKGTDPQARSESVPALHCDGCTVDLLDLPKAR